MKEQLDIIKSFSDQHSFFMLDDSDFCPEFICEKLKNYQLSEEEKKIINNESNFLNFLDKFKKKAIVNNDNGVLVFHYNITNIMLAENTIASKIKRIFEDEIKGKKLLFKIKEIIGEHYKIEYSNNLLKISNFKNKEEVKNFISKFNIDLSKPVITNQHILNKDKTDPTIYEKSYIVHINGEEEISKILNFCPVPSFSVSNMPEPGYTSKLQRGKAFYGKEMLHSQDPDNKIISPLKKKEKQDPNNNVTPPTKKQKSSSGISM